MKRSAAALGIVCAISGACSGKSAPTAPSVSSVPAGAAAAASPLSVRSVAPLASGAPTNLAVSVSGSTVTLTWGAPLTGDPVQTYVIEAGSRSGLADLATVPTNSTATTFSAGSIGSGTYYIRVKARSATGPDSAASNEVIAVVGSTCQAPGSPVLANATVTGGTVGLSWQAGSGGAPSSYVIEAGSAPGLSNLVNTDLGTASTGYTAAGVGAGTYYVRLRARNSCGTSNASNEITIVVGSTTTITGGTSLDGVWNGTSSQGQTFSLTVTGNAVSRLTYGYSGCGTASATTTFSIPSTITNNTWRYTSFGAGTSTTITATFLSNNALTGTISIQFTPIPFVQPCSGTVSATWTATK